MRRSCRVPGSSSAGRQAAFSCTLTFHPSAVAMLTRASSEKRDIFPWRHPLVQFSCVKGAVGLATLYSVAMHDPRLKEFMDAYRVNLGRFWSGG